MGTSSFVTKQLGSRLTEMDRRLLDLLERPGELNDVALQKVAALEMARSAAFRLLQGIEAADRLDAEEAMASPPLAPDW